MATGWETNRHYVTADILSVLEVGVDLDPLHDYQHVLCAFASQSLYLSVSLHPWLFFSVTVTFLTHSSWAAYSVYTRISLVWYRVVSHSCPFHFSTVPPFHYSIPPFHVPVNLDSRILLTVKCSVHVHVMYCFLTFDLRWWWPLPIIVRSTTWYLSMCIESLPWKITHK